MKQIIFKGCGTALVTPFTKNNINYNSLQKIIEFQISEHINSIIILGTTGEASTMSDFEKYNVIKFSINIINKKVPIIVGTGSNSTKKAIENSLQAKELGADALLIVTPYYNKTTQNGIIKHYTKIANSCNLPIIIYNIPSRTGLNIEPKTCFELSKIPNIVAIKEASSNISQIIKIKNLCKDELQIYSGNDDQILPILSIGGIGAISVISNILPNTISTMINNYLEHKNFDDFINTQINLIPLINELFSETNPIPIKEALNILGYNVGNPRLPLLPLSQKHKIKLKKLLYNI